MDCFFIEEPREEQPEQIQGDGSDAALGRQILAVQVVNAAEPPVGDQEPVGQLGHRHIFHGTQYPAGPGERQAKRCTPKQARARPPLHTFRSRPGSSTRAEFLAAGWEPTRTVRRAKPRLRAITRRA